MNGNDTKDLNDKLQVLVRLVAVGLTEGKPRQEQIKILAKTGMPPKEIADLLGTTPNSVSVALYQTKTKAAKKKPTVAKKEV